MALARQSAYLIVVQTGQTIPLNAPPALSVGRPDPALNIHPDIPFTDKTVERRHAIIDHKEGYTLEDLGSPNKTKLNGTILTSGQEYPLHDGDLIRFGAIEVRFKY